MYNVALMSIERYVGNIKLEMVYSDFDLYPIVVDQLGRFYVYDSDIDVYFEAPRDPCLKSYWDNIYDNHYHDSHRFCGHHPLVNLYPADAIYVDHMNVVWSDDYLSLFNPLHALTYYTIDLYEYTPVYWTDVYLYDYDYPVYTWDIYI